MAQYLNKDDLVERLINLKIEYQYDWNFAIDNVLKHINDLEVKEVDLEKEINGWYNTVGIPVTTDALKETARYFFELGLKAQKEIN